MTGEIQLENIAYLALLDMKTPLGIGSLKYEIANHCNIHEDLKFNFYKAIDKLVAEGLVTITKGNKLDNAPCLYRASTPVEIAKWRQKHGR